MVGGEWEVVTPLSLRTSGAQHFARAVNANVLNVLEKEFTDFPAASAGHRLSGIASLCPILASSGTVGLIASGFLGESCKPVRATLLNKSESNNWALGWHQDRTIAVRERRNCVGFRAWNIKAGVVHVEPPFEFIERMITLRVHLDDVSETNAPLKIAPGSHLLGRVEHKRLIALMERSDVVSCLAARGDVWAYATPIFHASSRAEKPARRRVLQIDYSCEALPRGLEWAGV
jgi:Phytanoyl-CoA dioxygenase (PhyH)